MLSTGDQDVGLYKHQAAIPYITSPGGELCVMRRNSFARKGKTQEVMQNSWMKTRGWWGKKKCQTISADYQQAEEKSCRALAAD